MRPVALSREQFHATVSEPVQDVTRVPEARLELDIWPYLEQVLETDYADRKTHRWDVKYVYQGDDGKFQQVFVSTDRRKVFLVVVLDVTGVEIVGHYELDMKREYA
jgi:hypothetical protein